MANSSNNSIVDYDESQRLGSWYPALLGLAEYFRTLNPPNIKLCVQCLQSIFHFNPPASIQARTHLQIGTVLSKGTKNVQLALSHLERAWATAQTCHSSEDIKFEAAFTSAHLLSQQGQFLEAKHFLRRATEQSVHTPFWHCKLLFELAQQELEENDHNGCILTLSAGFEYATLNQSSYSRLLFLLSKTMIFLIDCKLAEVQQCLTQAKVIMDQWPGEGQSHIKNLIEVFYLVIQVCQYLLVGQVKSVKPMLKQLQQTIQNVTTTYNDEELMKTLSPIELFHWLSKDHLCILVYLVTVMHSMQAGYLDKAQKYTEKALLQIDKLKSFETNPTLLSFQAMLLEHIIMCRLITGQKSIAIQQILQLCLVCHSNSKIVKQHNAYIHVLLGLYAMSINSMDMAESQFKVALNTHKQDQELEMFVSLNLALVYMRMGRVAEFNDLLQSIDVGRISTVSQSMKASTYYIQGLQAFFQSRHHEAKRYVRESLKMANTEDLNRLTACSLILFGHVFLSLGNNQEALNMINPALQLANKIPDIQVQLWATAVLKDLHRLLGNPQMEADSFRLHDSYSQKLLDDHFQATQSNEHQLVQWMDGPCPFFPHSTN